MVVRRHSSPGRVETGCRLIMIAVPLLVFAASAASAAESAESILITAERPPSRVMPPVVELNDDQLLERQEPAVCALAAGAVLYVIALLSPSARRTHAASETL